MTVDSSLPHLRLALLLGRRGDALDRWHIPDPIRFQRDLHVMVQALGW
jgi:hypothetical protein